MASLNVLVKLLPSSPFRLSRCFFIGVRLFPSSSISWAMLAVSILFCNLDFIGCHVFDINSVRHIYFQGQYSLHFFPSFAVFSKFYSLLWLHFFPILSLLFFFCSRFRIFSLTRGSIIGLAGCGIGLFFVVILGMGIKNRSGMREF